MDLGVDRAWRKPLWRSSRGDTLEVVKIDRLARSLTHLLEIIERLNGYGTAVRSLSDPIDTSSSSGRLTLQLLGAVAEFERSLIRGGAALCKIPGRRTRQPADQGPRAGNARQG